MSCVGWTSLLERFFRHIVEHLPKRNAVVAIDATSYSGHKRGWRETQYAHRARDDWVKIHVTNGVDPFLILSNELTASNVHDSKVFSDVCMKLTENIVPIHSLADSAYHGEACLAAARLYGAAPPYKNIKNANSLMEHRVNNKRIFFARQFPQRFAVSAAKRNHAETVFSMICNRSAIGLDAGIVTQVKGSMQAHQVQPASAGSDRASAFIVILHHDLILIDASIGPGQ